MQIMDNQKREVAAFFNEFWALVKAFYNPEHAQAYWTEQYNRAKKIYDRYPGKLERSLIISFLKCQDERYIEGKNGKGAKA